MLYFNVLRHIFAQALLDEGLIFKNIQFLSDHESITTTQKRYTMFARPDLKEKSGRMGDVIRLRRIS